MSLWERWVIVVGERDGVAVYGTPYSRTFSTEAKALAVAERYFTDYRVVRLLGGPS